MITVQHVVVCNRCRKEFPCSMCFDSAEELFDERLVQRKCTQQASHCSTTVRTQIDLPKDYFGFLDCPPTNEYVKPGELYLQSFYPSSYDCLYFSFTVPNDAVRATHPWIKNEAPTNVCDYCIADMRRKKEIEIASFDEYCDCSYPCFCHVCDSLYENNQTKEFTSNGTGCDVGAFQLPDGTWGFCDARKTNGYSFEIVKFPNLDLNSLKRYSRICNKCFEEFPNKYGALTLVTDEELHPWLSKNNEEE